MKKELKEKWVAALRSGEYRQVKGNLNKPLVFHDENGAEVTKEGYCCLGVLCVVAGIEKEKWDGLGHLNEVEVEPGKYLEAIGDYEEGKHALEVVGMTEDQETAAIMMNDNGKSFETIAEWVEKNVKEEA